MVEIKNLCCGYGEKEVIKNIFLRIEKGSFSGIIGPNGSGKTTLLKSIAGILKPKKGEILIGGDNIYKISPLNLAKKIAYLPSAFDIHFSYTVEEFIIMGRFAYTGKFGRFSEEDLKIFKKTVELLGLEKLKKRNIWELSDGEKQRTYLAQALVQQPSLLLLDEPTSHLDIGHQFKIMDILKKLNENGLTIISIFHNLNLASEYCNYLILLKDGEIYKEGKVEEVLTYQNIEEVYQTKVIVHENPYSKKPYVFGIPKRFLYNNNEEPKWRNW